MNKVLLTGTIYDKSIYYKPAEDGKQSFIKFSLSIQNSHKNKKTNKYESSYIPCIAFRDTADFINRNFTKGQAMEITEAKLIRSHYEKNGEKVYETLVNVSKVEFAPRNYDITHKPQPQFTDPKEYEENTVYPADEELAGIFDFELDTSFFNNNDE
ncbi:single-stranded DNA-binding protein [Erysipelothrix aquatica]|uniref:single-stranded DNA-binding protein n=1 Tax=Erysipelothrix aquatica TaxID=2683714 RepID=UPI00135A0486|nr:single-stranded DNA-binding protein [Erysipelothrix aquatica]